MGKAVTNSKMRFLVIVSLISIAYSARLSGKSETPSFVLVEERSLNGSPSIAVTFPDGYQDTLVLNKFYANEQNRMASKERCHYIGHLENEVTACVAVTGCVGSQDVQFTILSKHARKSSTFKWSKDGNVEDMKNAAHGNRKAISVPRTITQAGDDELILSEIEEAEFAVAADCADGTCTLPATQHMQIQVGYDTLFLDQFDDEEAAEEYIDSIWTHLQTNYCHETLTSSVLIERLDDINVYDVSDITDDLANLSTDSDSLTIMQDTTAADIGDADLMLYLAYVGDWSSGGGIAYGAVTCESSDYNAYKQSINGYGYDASSMGELLAHEIGHNLGMYHDFDTSHGGTGSATTSTNDCNYQGFMSYYDHLSQWSDCSISDFTAHYTDLADSWCMPESTAASSACGDTTEEPDTTTEEPVTDTTTEEPVTVTDTTTEEPVTTTEACEDNWTATKCAKKEEKGKCSSNSNVITNCQATCGYC